MKINPLTILATLSCAFLASCFYPASPHSQQPPLTKPNSKLSVSEQRQLEILNAKKEGRTPNLSQFQSSNNQLKPITPPVIPEAPKPPLTPVVDTNVSVPDTPVIKPPSIDPPTIKPPTPTAKKSWPYATAVPGKEGFVFNPYNNAQVDVRGLSSGTLVKVPGRDDQQFYVP